MTKDNYILEFDNYQIQLKNIRNFLNLNERTFDSAMRNCYVLTQNFQDINVEKDTVLHFLADREKFNDDFLYYKMLLCVKIWSGFKIKKQDFEHLSPIVGLYIGILLEKKFKLKFDIQYDILQQQIHAIHNHYIVKRDDYYIYYLVK